jgi:hypothetical protein
MDTKDIRKSQLLHELCGGLCVELSVYRRGADQDLFDLYTSLYEHADDDSKVPEIVTRLCEIYPYDVMNACEHYFVISHKKRMILNRVFNWHFAQFHHPLKHIPCCGEMPGATMQPQEMIVWEGMELLCYRRRYSKNSPVSGAVYVVEAWDKTHLTVSLHDDYIGERLFEAAPVEEQAEAEDEDDDTPSDDEALEELEQPVDLDVEVETRKIRRPDGSEVEKPFYKLIYTRASEILRPQHALVYASIQGRTMRNSVGLMDLDHKNMTTRDIITAMSRPISGADLHFVTPEQQRTLFHDIEAKKVDFDLLQRVLQSRQQEPSERRTPSRVGR